MKQRAPQAGKRRPDRVLRGSLRGAGVEDGFLGRRVLLEGEDPRRHGPVGSILKEGTQLLTLANEVCQGCQFLEDSVTGGRRGPGKSEYVSFESS